MKKQIATFLAGVAFAAASAGVAPAQEDVMPLPRPSPLHLSAMERAMGAEVLPWTEDGLKTAFIVRTTLVSVCHERFPIQALSVVSVFVSPKLPLLPEERASILLNGEQVARNQMRHYAHAGNLAKDVERDNRILDENNFNFRSNAAFLRATRQTAKGAIFSATPPIIARGCGNYTLKTFSKARDDVYEIRRYGYL